MKNRIPTKILDHKTPFEVFYGLKPIVSHLRIYGIKSFSHGPKEDRINLDSKEITCILLVIVLITKHTKCMIPPLISFLQEDMYYFKNI
jgi:hypothetical protein